MTSVSRGWARVIVAAAFCSAGAGTAGLAQAPQTAAPIQSQAPALPIAPPPEPPLLVPTVRTALPQRIDDYWFAPTPAERAASPDPTLASAAAAYASGNLSAALSAARQAVARGGALVSYAQFYVAQSQLRLGESQDAGKSFDAVAALEPDGRLASASMMGKAEALEQRGDYTGAADIYDKLASQKVIAPDDVLLHLGRAAQAAGDRPRAAAAFLRAYYQFPLSDTASAAGSALGSLQDVMTRTGYKLDLGRALVLFGAKRYTEARSAFEDLHKEVSGDDREVVDLRIAECDYFLKRYAAARDEASPFRDQASRRAEARFFYLDAIQGLGDTAQAIALTRQLVDDFPDSTWSEEALANLATHYILTDQDDLAAATFRESIEKFPSGVHAERAAWKYGWWAYRNGHYSETVRVFERAAADFPHSDYRPPYLYWSARARARMGDTDLATARLRLVYTDYRNSYYGRLARRKLGPAAADAAADGAVPDSHAGGVADVTGPPPQAAPPNAALIRQLLAAGLFDDASLELRYAQAVWGTSPAIEATQAWILHERGDLRKAINAMRHAYPQFLASGGEGLPPQILQIIFPLTYWDAIQHDAAAHGLDPFVVAALINQESTFDAGARSPANAWGLMQIVPSTGRKLAASLGIRRFSTSMLTNGETNIRLGTLYFSTLVEKFGGVYYALASYDAGDGRVERWKAERPGIEEDEFIDDIPFPETQNYVKRILGQAEDYRHLYGEVGAQPGSVVKAATRSHPTATRTPTHRASSSHVTTHTAVAKKHPTAKHTASKHGAAKKKPAAVKKKS